MIVNKYQIRVNDFCVEILDDYIPLDYSTIVNRLNEQHETIQQLQRADNLTECETKQMQYRQKVKETLQKHYNSSKKDYEVAVKSGMPSSISYDEMSLFEELAKELGVDLE